MNASVDQRRRAAAAALGSERVALQALAAAHGPAALGSVLALLAAAACAVPMAGAGTVPGFGLLMLVPALARGSGGTCLSQRLARLEMPLSVARRLLT